MTTHATEAQISARARLLLAAPVHRRQHACAAQVDGARQWSAVALAQSGGDARTTTTTTTTTTQRARRGARRARHARRGLVDDPIVLGAPTALTDDEAALLRGYVLSAARDSEQHYAAASFNRRMHRALSMTHLVLLAVTTGGTTVYNVVTGVAAANASSSAGGGADAAQLLAYSIVLNVLLIVATAIKGAQTVFRFNERSTLYEMSGDDFLNYMREWRLRMAQGVDDRRDKCALAVHEARHKLQVIELNALPLHSAAAAPSAAAGATRARGGIGGDGSDNTVSARTVSIAGRSAGDADDSYYVLVSDAYDVMMD